MKVIKIPLKPVKCPRCSKRFKTNKNIARHIKQQHSKYVKKFQCIFCNELFQNKTNYNIHHTRKHSIEFLLYAEPRDVTVTGEKFIFTIIVSII